MAGGAFSSSRRAELGAVFGSPSTRRDPLSAAELRQAGEWRAMGASFDAIAKMLGRSGLDVRAALADAPPPRRGEAPPPPAAIPPVLPPASPAPAVARRVRPPRVRGGSFELATLRALIAEEGDGLTGGQVAAVIGRPLVSALAMLGILARKGFAVREPAEAGTCWRRPKFLWCATEAGVAEAARHRGSR